MSYPIKLNDNYTCQGIDADGKSVVYGDLLDEGDLVGPCHPGEEDDPGEAMYVDARVVRREDGLWVKELGRCEKCGSRDRGQRDWGLDHAQRCGGEVVR